LVSVLHEWNIEWDRNHVCLIDHPFLQAEVDESFRGLCLKCSRWHGIDVITNRDVTDICICFRVI